MRHCAERLLRYMVPKEITLLTRLAKSLTGKIHRTSFLTGRKIRVGSTGHRLKNVS